MAKVKAFLSALKLSVSAGEGPNEDTAVVLRQDGVRLLAAFDGCGGVGGRRYAQLDNRTGAHIASGLYAECLKEWFAQSEGTLPRDPAAETLDALFSRTAREYHTKYLQREPSAVTGSMVRTLPSTAAIALMVPGHAALYWAGNTRAYLLTGSGLKQLTQDDYATRCDTFDSLSLDAPISNYLCADQPFGLHEAAVDLPKEGVLVLATDGAYQAPPTPMHFEALLLDALALTETKKQWKKGLKESLITRAADDATLLLQPFGFDGYAQLSPYFDKRRRHVRQAYILPADQAEANSRLALKSLWEMYQKE